MCGRYVLGRQEGFTERFKLQRPLDGFFPRYNAAPTQQLPVVLEQPDGERLAELMRWGLIFPWAKDDPKAPRPFNARSETLAENAAFRKLASRQRCLVPAEGFYEWQQAERGRGKQPYYFTVRDEPFLAFAGIYDHYRDESGQEMGSYAVLTTSPNELMSRYHNRMPVILRPDDEADWLDPAATDPLALERFYEPFPADLMEVRPANPRVNNTRNEGPDLILPPAP
jgi:putative SOS response-associated peptidase YedK